MFDIEVDSIIPAAVLLLVYEFLIIVIYLFFSEPFIAIVAGFQGLSVPEVQTYTPKILTYFTMMMAIAGVVPILWFIVWVYHREPDWRFNR